MRSALNIFSHEDMQMSFSVRKARMGDIRTIHSLLLTSSADGLLLPRSLSELYGHLRDFYVVEDDGFAVGCGALSIIWENMAEVRSLAVAPEARRKGCGTCLWMRALRNPVP